MLVFDVLPESTISECYDGVNQVIIGARCFGEALNCDSKSAYLNWKRRVKTA